jgi:hypothetical protein
MGHRMASVCSGLGSIPGIFMWNWYVVLERVFLWMHRLSPSTTIPASS